MTDHEPTNIQLIILIIRTWWRDRKAKPVEEQHSPWRQPTVKPSSFYAAHWFAVILAAHQVQNDYLAQKKARRLAEEAQRKHDETI